MDFAPIVRDPKPMDRAHLPRGRDGAGALLLGLSLAERISYDRRAQHPVLNLEGFHVRTIDDVELVRREFERACREIGRKVHLIANYDGFQIDPSVSDAYFSAIAYLQKRYYETASRYTTSAFMRLKLGASLASRDLAPHVFETKAEAQARNTAQSVPLKPRTVMSETDMPQPPKEPLDA